MWVGAQMGGPICHITKIPIYLKSWLDFENYKQFTLVYIITISHKPYIIASDVYYYKHALGDNGKLYFFQNEKNKI